MIRYLKYIVLVFGSIGIAIGLFFYYQNRNDINHFIKYKKDLSYESVLKDCNLKGYNKSFDCFKPQFETFLESVSLTGNSIGLKLGFNFIDDQKDELQTDDIDLKKFYELTYSLNYLELNNIAIRSAFKNYKGAENLYAGFIISLERFYRKAYEFSDNLFIGLDGDEGIRSLNSLDYKKQIMERRNDVSESYIKARKLSQQFIRSERKKHDPNQKN